MLPQHRSLQPDTHTGATAADRDSPGPLIPPATGEWTVPRVIVATTAVVALAVLAWLLLRFRSIVAIILLAMVLGTAIRPAVDWLASRRVPRPVALLGLYLLVLALGIGAVMLLLPLVAEQAFGIAGDIPRYYATVRSLMVNSSSRLLQSIGRELPPFLNVNGQAPDGQGLGDVGAFLHYGLGVVRLGVFLAGVLLASFYWAAESRRLIQQLLLVAPMTRREELRALVAEIEGQVGAYMRVQGLLSVAVGAMAFIAYSLVGLPYTLVLAIIAGITELIPVLGPILGAAVALVVALSTDASKAGWTLVAAAAIQQIENSVLVPQLLSEGLGLSPVVTILALTTLGSLLGLPGALLAAPLTAIVEILLRRVVMTGEGGQSRIALRDQIGALRYRARQIIEDIRSQVKKKQELPTATSDEVEDSLESITTTIDGILGHLEQQRTAG